MCDNENNFTLNGVEYVAVDANANGMSCVYGCDLNRIGLCSSAPSCAFSDRKDGREVVFKKSKLATPIKN